MGSLIKMPISLSYLTLPVEMCGVGVLGLKVEHMSPRKLDGYEFKASEIQASLSYIVRCRFKGKKRK